MSWIIAFISECQQFVKYHQKLKAIKKTKLNFLPKVKFDKKNIRHYLKKSKKNLIDKMLGKDAFEVL